MIRMNFIRKSLEMFRWALRLRQDKHRLRACFLSFSDWKRYIFSYISINSWERLMVIGKYNPGPSCFVFPLHFLRCRDWWQGKILTGLYQKTRAFFTEGIRKLHNILVRRKPASLGRELWIFLQPKDECFLIDVLVGHSLADEVAYQVPVPGVIRVMQLVVDAVTKCISVEEDLP